MPTLGLQACHNFNLRKTVKPVKEKTHVITKFSLVLTGIGKFQSQYKIEIDPS